MRDSPVHPLLPKWPFYVANSFLVLFAIFIACQAKGNLSATHIFWCICSVFLGAVLFIYPFSQEFKAYISLQKSRNTALSKEQAQQLGHTLYQLQEMKESILKNNHKQALDQTLITSTLQSLEERLNIILDKNSNPPEPIYPIQASLASIEAKLQSLLDTVSLNTSVREPFVKEPVGAQSISTEGLAPEANGPSPFFRPYAAGPSLEDLETSPLSPLDETLQVLYPEDEEEKVKRNLFSEEKEKLSSRGDHSFAFDFDNLVPQNLFSPKDNTSLDLDTEEEPSSSFFTASSSLDMPSSSLFSVEEKKQSAQESSVAVAEYPLDKEKTYNPAQGTSLIVHANLGIGKKPYIRGQGPGLNWSYGIPMAFIEMGKWQWTAPDSSQPIICRIYKNDEVPAEGEVLCLQPGEQVELSPGFKG